MTKRSRLSSISALSNLASKRVVVAMSGGVDSSVAAALLVEQGYQVIGMMMRLWSEPTQASIGLQNRCCTPDQMADARRIADKLQIPFYVVDAKEYFYRTVVKLFIEAHASGETPNPCIECNRKVRFSFLLEHAIALGADFLATGHYARIQEKNGRYHLLRAIDKNKDQSYVLHVLNQEKLARTLFPIGDYTKSDVRQIATKFHLPVALKNESMDLCFLADGDYRRFIREHSPGIGRPGNIINQSGKILGEHQGLPYYTIGQRKGLGIATGEPIFVLEKDTESNTLFVGSREMLSRRRLFVRDLNWVSGAPPSKAEQLSVKIRYKAPSVPGSLTIKDNHSALVELESYVFGVTSGQAAVFYDGEECIGGGIITDEHRR